MTGERRAAGESRGATRRTVLRAGGLAALAAAVAWLAAWRGGSTPTARAGGPLGERGPLPRCAGCVAFIRCVLPEAEAARERGYGLVKTVRGPAAKGEAGRALCAKAGKSDV
jgi:hypothetical protein